MANEEIDLTDLVDKMQATFILAGKDYLLGLALAVPGVGTVAAWFLKILGGPVITWCLTKLSTWAVMRAFFLNTAIRKASQRIDYEKAVDFKDKLPPTTGDEEYAKAERAEIDSFNKFVKLTT